MLQQWVFRMDRRARPGVLCGEPDPQAWGYYVFYDIHPFTRPWKDQTTIEMDKPYFETGPFEDGEPGQRSYEFHWTLSDMINPLLGAGLILRQMAETPAEDARFWQDASYRPGTDERLLDWHQNPRAGLPVWLTIAAQKPAQPGPG